MGNVLGERGRVFGNWDRMEGAKLSQREGYPGLAGQCLCLLVALLILAVSGEDLLSPLFLGSSNPCSPLHPSLPFFSYHPFIKISSNILSSFLTALAGKERLEAAAERSWLLELPSYWGVCFFLRAFASLFEIYGHPLLPALTLERLTLIRRT